MALKNKLDSVAFDYMSEMRDIGGFVAFVDQSLTKKQQKTMKEGKGFSEEKLKELKTFAEKIVTSFESAKKVHIPASPEVTAFLLEYLMSFTEKRFLAEMSLAYLISYQEAFVKDYLYEILVHLKHMLKSAATVTYEEVLGHASMKSLVGFVAQKEIDSLGYGSIDDVQKYFLRRFNIDLRKFDKWDKVKEMNYRRNIIVHNKARTNETYCNKTGYKKVNQLIKTDYKYVSKAVDTLSSFIGFIHGKCLVRLKLQKWKT